MLFRWCAGASTYELQCQSHKRSDRNAYILRHHLERTGDSDPEPRTLRSKHAQRTLGRRCFRPCTRARNAPTPSRYIMHNIRWHTACAGVCMTKTSAGPARFVAYDLSLQLVTAIRLAAASWRTVGDLADQGRRAAISVALNLREGSAYLAHHGANQRTLGAGSLTVASSFLRHRAWFRFRS